MIILLVEPICQKNLSCLHFTLLHFVCHFCITFKMTCLKFLLHSKPFCKQTRNYIAFTSQTTFFALIKNVCARIRAKNVLLTFINVFETTARAVFASIIKQYLIFHPLELIASAPRTTASTHPIDFAFIVCTKYYKSDLNGSCGLQLRFDMRDTGKAVTSTQSTPFHFFFQSNLTDQSKQYTSDDT